MNTVEKATIRDVTQMHKLINYFADKGEMLARPLSEIYENIRDYFIVRQGERVIACAALHVNWLDLAEIKSLAVAEDSQKLGIGNQLVEACLKEAEELGIATIFCLTYKPAFFEQLGFSQIDKMELPHKVWAECYRCPKFPDCDEVALIYHLAEGV
ncbi:Amino-acid acetyltransferase [subsurface metagenome]